MLDLGDFHFPAGDGWVKRKETANKDDFWHTVKYVTTDFKNEIRCLNAMCMDTPLGDKGYRQIPKVHAAQN